MTETQTDPTSLPCADASDAFEEDLAGTASTVRSWLLVEQDGPWGIDALHDSRLPPAVARTLEQRCRRARVRPLLIRGNAGEAGRPGVRVFAVHTTRRRTWAETTVLDDVAGAADIDIAALGAGDSPGLDPHDRPLALVCTNGRHDRCCASRGIPVARALRASHPDITWECSHVGGDRFAGNLVLLPDGVYYGRVRPEDAATVVADHLEGRLALDHLRGRSTVAFVVQAAEIALRRRLGATGIDDVAVVSAHRDGNETTARFAVDGRVWAVRMRTAAGAPRRLTCRAGDDHAPPVHTPVAVREVGAA